MTPVAALVCTSAAILILQLCVCVVSQGVFMQYKQCSEVKEGTSYELEGFERFCMIL